MSRLRVAPLLPRSPEARLRTGLAATGVCLALALALTLSALAVLRGVSPSGAMLLGIALGLCAELLCIDLAVRRVCRRLGAFDEKADRHRAGGRSRAIAATVR